jgi:cell division septation protein DedD
MNNHQRAVYQPMMENVPIYDLADDEAEEERSRLPLLIVIALVVLAAFAGVVWLAYNQGVARGRAGNEVVIAAPEGPVRTAPDDAGNSTPYTGLKVYSQPLPPDQEAESSSLAQSAASGMALEIVRQAEPESPPAETPVRLNPETLPNTAPPPAAAPAAPKPAAPKPAVQTAIAAPATPAPAKPAPAATAAAGGGILLQIGAYPSEDLANGAWAAFKARHTDVAGALSPDIQKADLGTKGTWYRLRAGPFADRTTANAACVKLKAAGATCFLATP